MWSVVNILILVIVVVGAVAIAYTVCRAMGVEIPAWVVKVGWILLAVFVGVLALRLLAGIIWV